MRDGSRARRRRRRRVRCAAASKGGRRTARVPRRGTAAKQPQGPPRRGAVARDSVVGRRMSVRDLPRGGISSVAVRPRLPPFGSAKSLEDSYIYSARIDAFTTASITLLRYDSRARHTLPTARFASLLSLPKLCDAAPAARVNQNKECPGPARRTTLPRQSDRR